MFRILAASGFATILMAPAAAAATISLDTQTVTWATRFGIRTTDNTDSNTTTFSLRVLQAGYPGGINFVSVGDIQAVFFGTVRGLADNITS